MLTGSATPWLHFSQQSCNPRIAHGRRQRMTVRQLRGVVQADDYAQAVAFYRDALGLTEEEAFTGDDGAQVMILDAGRATLEIANAAQVRMIDDVEVGRQVSPHIRIAFQVDDAATATATL